MVVSFSGLSSRSFKGFHDIQQIQCSAEALPPDSDLFFMVLYQVTDKSKTLGKLNVNRKECSTSEDYVSCEIFESESRRSRLKALIADLAEGQSRVYGCNVTALISGSTTGIMSWSITVYRVPRKFEFFLEPLSFQMDGFKSLLLFFVVFMLTDYRIDLVQSLNRYFAPS